MVRNRKRQRGFTLIELMVVMSILLILISISVPIYNQSITRAKEAVLRDDLFQLRSLINQYTLDKQKAPQSLEDLVSGGYLKQLPKDPLTNSSETWQTEAEDVLLSADQSEPGITDVKSGASFTSLDGSPYNTW